jgi:excisionase family DNA binding protein
MTSDRLLTSAEAAAQIAAAVAAEMRKYVAVEPTLNLAEAAGELGISVTVMRQMCRERKIPCVRLEKSYRIKVRDLNAFLDARTMEAAG